jgi:hypothetical protein
MLKGDGYRQTFLRRPLLLVDGPEDRSTCRVRTGEPGAREAWRRSADAWRRDALGGPAERSVAWKCGTTVRALGGDWMSEMASRGTAEEGADVGDVTAPEMRLGGY